MIKVVADTNALLMPFQLKMNIDSELDRLLGNHQILVPEPIIGELERLADARSEAKAALELAKTRDVLPTTSSGDDSVLELAQREAAYVLSNDKALIQRATSAGLKVIRLREGSRLSIENEWVD